MDNTPGETQVRAVAEEIFHATQQAVPAVFQPHAMAGRLMEWVLQDAALKVDLFRLVDVLPALQSSHAVRAHVAEYLRPGERDLPLGLTGLLKIASGRVAAGLTAHVVRKAVKEMGLQFIVAENWEEASPRLRALDEGGVGATVDLLGEVTLSGAEADAYLERYVALVDALGEAAESWPEAPVLILNHLGPIPRANVSVKLSALEPHLDPVDLEGSIARLKKRVLPLLVRAQARGVFVNLDMETWALHGITLGFLEEALSTPELRSWPHVGVAIQAYMKDAESDLHRLLALAIDRGAPITVRLVKGAYWEYEIIHARQHGYGVPVLESKATTDAQYERLTGFLLEHCDDLLPAFGTHNLRSIAHARACADALGLPKDAYEFQMLYGMAEPLREALIGMGHRLRVYAPIGDLIPGMAYLVRRLLENTSNEGFLRRTYHEKEDLDILVAKPEPMEPETPPDAGFRSFPHRDFTDDVARQELAEAVRQVAASFPFEVPLCSAGEQLMERPILERVAPNDGRTIIARVAMAKADDVDHAVAISAKAWPEWRDTPVEGRAALLEALADRLNDDRARLAALEIHEVGKPWADADADVTEAIDFCRYYAQQARVELAERAVEQAPGETNRLWYEGRGPTAVIAPWNFPLAILCGMTTAALVAGNTVIMKPAEQSSATGFALYQHLLAVGIPPNVVQFLPGYGEEVGTRLVDHPLIAQAAFTGSRAVGTAIRERIGRQAPGQSHLKRMVCEMGGKNALIIDDDADLDEAVHGTIVSAFGYAGQKCSACSRVLVLQAVYEPYVSRLIEACRSLHIAPSADPACQVPPVVDQEAYDRLMAVHKNLGDGAEVLYAGARPEGDGLFVPPLLYRARDNRTRLMQEELFGPILGVLPVETFEDALAMAVDSPFALTGGVYSRSPHHIELARQQFRVGNLYLNRPCTASMVGRQPFGGFNMSGGGTKAGGPGYLLHFTDPRCVTENTVRRGFSPEVIL